MLMRRTKTKKKAFHFYERDESRDPKVRFEGLAGSTVNMRS